MVELGGEGHLVFRLGKTLFDGLCGVCATALQALSEFGNGRRLDEEAQGFVAIVLLDVHTTFHIDVEDNVLSLFALAFYLLLQGTVEAVVIYLFVLQELVLRDSVTKLIRRDEEVLYTILLRASWRSAGAADGEIEP